MTWRGVTIARVAGIPIRAHGTLLLLVPMALLGLPLSLWPLGLAVIAGALASVALHELGHSLVAVRFGCRPIDILLLPIGGLARLSCLPRRPREEMLVAAAGPVVSLALALALSAAARWLAVSSPAMSLLATDLGRVNRMLAVFNLIPSFPMDGGRILRAVLVPRMGRLLATRVAAWIGQAFAVMLIVWGILPPLRVMQIVLGFFLYHAASAEWRQTLRHEAWNDVWGWTPHDPLDETGGIREIDDDVVVGPPPYEQRSFRDRWRRRSR